MVGKQDYAEHEVFVEQSNNLFCFKFELKFIHA